MYSYVSTYQVYDSDISVKVAGSQTLSDLMNTEFYMAVSNASGVQSILDMSQYMLVTPNLNFTQTLTQIASSLTDLQVAGLKTTEIPQIDGNTNGFDNRLNVYDANTASDCCVAWTSISDPTVRNDIYQRDTLNDLVISSKTRNFLNCLVAVNGVFHKTYYYNGELYVQNGYFNIRNTRRTDIAIYDTAGLGGHAVLPIAAQNIDASNTNPFSGVTLTFPEWDFTESTLLLVLGGYIHILDGTYRLLNRNRIQIDINKIDLINQFLHNPNTIYNKAFAREQILDPIWAPATRDTQPTIYDKIYWWLQHQPQPYDPAEPAIFAHYQWANNRLSKPSQEERIYAWLESEASVQWNPSTPAQLTDWEWTSDYTRLSAVVQTVHMKHFEDPRFIYNTLTLPSTFFVVLNNARIFRRRYHLARSAIPAQFLHRGEDTPRGTLVYNDSWTPSYLLYSETMREHHNFSLGHAKTAIDTYKTALNPIAVASPVFDVHNPAVNYPAHLLDLFAAAS